MKNISWTTIVKEEGKNTYNIKRIGHDNVHEVLYIQYEDLNNEKDEKEIAVAFKGVSYVLYENLLKAIDYKEFIEEQLEKNYFFGETQI